MIRRLLLLVLLLFPIRTWAAGCAGTGSCFWKGGSGNASSTTNWATTSGGSTTGSIPTATDDCIFDTSSSTANSAYTWTVDASTACKNLTMAGPGGGNKVTWAGSQAISIAGNYNTSGGSAGITMSYTGNITFTSTSAQIITTAGLACNAKLIFNGAGGSWSLQDNLSSTASDTGRDGINLTNGTIVTNGHTLSYGSFTLLAGTKAITLGSDTFNATSFTTAWDTNSNKGGFTFTSAPNSTISVTSNSAKNFFGGGATFGTVKCSGTGACTYNTSATFTWRGAADTTSKFIAPTNVFTITGVISDGTSGHPATIQGNTTGTASLWQIKSGTPLISPDFLSIKDIRCEGSCCLPGAHSTNVSNTPGWIWYIAAPRCPTGAFFGGGI